MKHQTLGRTTVLAIVPMLLSLLFFSTTSLASPSVGSSGFASAQENATPVTSDPGNTSVDNEEQGGFGAAGVATNLSLSQTNPLPGERIDLAYTFHQVAEDEGSMNLAGRYSPYTTYNNDVAVQCSVTNCLGTPIQLNTNSVEILFNSGNGGIDQTIVLSFSVTVSGSVAPGTQLDFTGVGDPATPFTASAVVAAPLDAQDGSATVAYERSVNGTLSSTGGVSPVFYNASTLPTKGTVSVLPDGGFTYTANAGETGADQFDFTAYDSRNPPQNSTGTISITISDPVIANDTNLDVDFEDSASGAVTATGGVGTLTFAVLDQPYKGTVVVNGDGTFTYTANSNVTGSDQFTVTASDASTPPLTDVANVFVTIGAPPPLTTDPLTIDLDAGETVTGNLADQVSGGILPYTFVLDSQATQGVATVNADGSFTFIANPDASGVDSFTYMVSDSNIAPAAADVATVTGTVNLNIAAPSTPTEVPTVAATETPQATGSAAITLITNDGGDVPDSTTVCVGTICQVVGADASAAAASGTTLMFTDLDPGFYDVTVSSASPYADTAGSLQIVAEQTTEVTIELQRDVATVTPTQPTGATPVATVTVAPTSSAAPTGSVGVKALPNTGSGQGSSSTSLLMLVMAMLTVVTASALATWKRRSHKS